MEPTDDQEVLGEDDENAEVPSDSISNRVAKIIEEWTPEDGDFVAAIVAEKLLAGLAETAPELLEGWLHENARRFLTDEIGRRSAALRSKAVKRASSRAFGRSAKAAADGDSTELGHFTVDFVVAADSTRRRVADMDGDDHKFVADSYQRSGTYDLMLAAFHRAVAKTVGKRHTSEVMSEEQYDQMLQSFLKRAA